MHYIYKVGVIGAGQMGAGIAQAITFAGVPVVLIDSDEAALERGAAAVAEIYEGRVRKGKMTPQEMHGKLALLETSRRLDGLAEADLVVEAVFEDLEVKRELFGRLDRIAPQGCLFASNTSSLSISAMAAASGRGERFVGMHFFYPAHLMKLVEIVPALQTAPETVDAAVSFAETLRKIPVRVRDCPGFLVNRLLAPYLNEAVRCAVEGAARPREIDEAMTKGFGMPMGPFQLLDAVGIDLALQVSGRLAEAYGPRFESPEALERLRRAGRTGRRSGAGFYVYDDRPLETAEEELAKLVRRVAESRFSPERLLYAMLNEACACLEEGVASESDLDVALIAGIGFPQAEGGILHWADRTGLDAALQELRRLAGIHGARFRPHVHLRRRVDAGWTGRAAGRGFFEVSP